MFLDNCRWQITFLPHPHNRTVLNGWEYNIWQWHVSFMDSWNRMMIYYCSSPSPVWINSAFDGWNYNESSHLTSFVTGTARNNKLATSQLGDLPCSLVAHVASWMTPWNAGMLDDTKFMFHKVPVIWIDLSIDNSYSVFYLLGINTKAFVIIIGLVGDLSPVREEKILLIEAI